MTAKLDYRWHLRQVMATRDMFSTTDLIAPLAERGITLSSSQVYRLVVERPERLSLKILMALLDILDCTMDELIEPVAAADTQTRKAAARCGLRGECGQPAAEAGPHHPHGPMTISADPICDPVATVVDLVAAADPALDAERDPADR